GITRSNPTSPVSGSSCRSSPLRSSRSRTRGGLTGSPAVGGGRRRRAAVAGPPCRAGGGPSPPRGPAPCGARAPSRCPRGPGRAGGHPLGRRPRVAVRHPESRLAVTHRLPQPWAVGGEGRRPAGRGLHVGDAPPLLGTGKYDRPRRAQQTPLLLVGDEPEEPHP